MSKYTKKLNSILWSFDVMRKYIESVRIYFWFCLIWKSNFFSFSLSAKKLFRFNEKFFDYLSTAKTLFDQLVFLPSKKLFIQLIFHRCVTCTLKNFSGSTFSSVPNRSSFSLLKCTTQATAVCQPATVLFFIKKRLRGKYFKILINFFQLIDILFDLKNEKLLIYDLWEFQMCFLFHFSIWNQIYLYLICGRWINFDLFDFWNSVQKGLVQNCVRIYA